jgi:Ca2+-binding EF-hand superfamily protein
MKNTFSKMQKVVDGTALDYVFNLADTSGDGLINYDEFNALFIKMSKEG